MSIEQLPPDLRRVHMVGIGGAGMSGIARILLDRGGLVSGSDAKESRGVHALRARGALIRIGHDVSSLDLLPGGATAVVTTHAAIPKTNPELVEARRRGIPVVLRPVVLAKLMAGRTTLMVSGTHGKTTTTSMLIVALQHCGRDPSFAVGGELGEAGTNAHHGSGDCFVAEADESDGSLLEYTPNVAVVTNIESDHLDFYGSAEAYVGVFDSFVERIAPGGALVVCTDDPGAAALAQRTADLGIRVLGYGSAPAPRDTSPASGRYRQAATLLSWEQHGTEAVAHIQLASDLAPAPHPRVMRLSVPGRHMALNALGALLAAVDIGAPVDGVLDGLAGFEGVRRRFELVGTSGVGKALVRVFDDYAHHPTEISATLAAVRMALKQGDGGRCVVVFQPHLYSRTKAFAAEFGHALNAADEVFVLDVYGAREQPLAGVSGASVAEHVTVPVRYLPDFSAVAEEVAAAAGPGDVIVTMGAGDVTLLGPEIVTALRIRANRSAPGHPEVLR
ncbi:UDP-N-acetylmuramate--L-alanine ligase [Mycobacterium decipiens]|uniref:UDP-N-acetylmuramate--L-alanine ligase n=1 Tax=Mycobacterium decipiens TaxID=1430326 RepID=A0A1X2LXB2_9MYCO|nr:UDP-N-acetylmuramate--L-alanine ligase [Mycobacterium decipiens]OSC41770.1 UDP-N-acetylmuramate--L-alanine ligase [Mycobacterium decipiens]